jgi:hypothetical protein
MIKRHYNEDFGLGDYLNETNLQKFKIEEEDTQEHMDIDEFEDEIDSADEKGSICQSENLTRDIVKKK